MSTTSPLQAIPLPEPADADNVPYHMAQAVAAIEGRLFMRFASAAARDTAVSAPVEGMVAWLADVNQATFYADGAWSIGFETLKPSANLMRQAGDFTVPSAGYIYSLPWQSGANGFVQGITVVNQRITVTRPGRYKYAGFQRVQHPASTVYNYVLNVKVNAGNDSTQGTLAEARYRYAPAVAMNETIEWGRTIKLSAGDYLETFITCPSGAVLAGGSKASDFSIEWMGY